MSVSVQFAQAGSPDKTKILRRLRWLAVPLALILLVGGVLQIVSPPFDPFWFFRIRGGWELCLGMLLLLPFQRWAVDRPRLWRRMFFLLLFASAVFVFARIIGVLFEARVVEAAGGELGLPAWSGTLIFFTLSQIPVILFLRFPDELE